MAGVFRSVWTVVLLLSSFSIINAAPTADPNISIKFETSTTTSDNVPHDACATVSSMVADINGAGPTAMADYPMIPAAAAMDCLRTVPFNASFALEWLDSFRPYLEWQSTISVLKNPPSGYWRNSWDIIGFLDNIVNRVKTQGYPNEWAFERDLYRIFAGASDGHMRYFPKIYNGIFAWGRPVPLVSISADGKALPRVYVYDDILLSINDTSFEPSPVVSINGADPQDVLRDAASWTVSSDYDAAYNSLFFSLAQSSLGYLGNGAGTWAGGGRGSVQYPDDWTDLIFENGTQNVMQNFARVLQNFDNITSGEDLRYRFLDDPSRILHNGNPPATAEAGDEKDASIQASIPSPPGYPQPINIVAGGTMGGYYLDTDGYEDVAVLNLATFGGGGVMDSIKMESSNFFQKAKLEGKTKLIIDLSANGGGQVPQAYSIFKNLFPDAEPYGASRFRAWKDFDLLGQVVSDAVGSNYPFDLMYPPGPGMLLTDFVATPFIAAADMDVNGQVFKSWSDKYGPHEFEGDQYTSLMRWNFSDPTLIQYSAGFEPFGYGNETNVREQPFAAENIIILTDGYCASSCAIFVELMTQHGKVRTVAVGGQPGAGKPGPMQAVGGVRGVNVYQMSAISSFAAEARILAAGTSREDIVNQTFDKYSSFPMLHAADEDGRFNVRDNIRSGEEQQVPLQFKYQAADCRIFYEKEHTVDASTLYRKVSDVAFHGGECVEGSIRNVNSDTTIRKRHMMRRMEHSELKQLRNMWRKGGDANKIKPIAGFQLP